MHFNIPDNETDIAVALSGGGDSMALAHRLTHWAQDNGRHIHLLHVDHKLRAESGQEAEQLLKWVADFHHSEFHILSWDHKEKPTAAIMEKARKARYDLMADYCKAHQIKTLAVAHHADDQMETFLFRLCKGSGLDGLSGMEEWTEYEDLKLYRPLLKETHNEQIIYCKNNKLKWIDDPSNENLSYARPRLRMALAAEGLDTKRFTKTLLRIARAREALDIIANNTYHSVYDQHSETGVSIISWNSLKSHPLDIKIRVVQKALLQTGRVAHSYPPKLERVEEIVTFLTNGKSATLYGCVLSLSKDGNTLEIKASTP